MPKKIVFCGGAANYERLVGDRPPEASPERQQCLAERAVGEGKTVRCVLDRHDRGDHQGPDGSKWLARRRRR